MGNVTPRVCWCWWISVSVGLKRPWVSWYSRPLSRLGKAYWLKKVVVPHVGFMHGETATPDDRLCRQKKFQAECSFTETAWRFFFYPQTCQASLIIDHYAKKSFLLWQELFPFKQGNGDCLPYSPHSNNFSKGFAQLTLNEGHSWLFLIVFKQQMTVWHLSVKVILTNKQQKSRHFGLNKSNKKIKTTL